MTLNTYAQTDRQEPYNRFQYHKFKWRTFHTGSFHVYFPYGYDSLGKYVIEQLPDAIERIKHRMITRLVKTPNVIVYPSPDQLYESNIGLYDLEDKTLPTFVSTGNRMVLFYNGDHTDMDVQLHEALVRAIWEDQMNDELKPQVNTNDDEAVPFWFKEGAIRYFANYWPIQAEDELRRSFQNNSFQNWQQVIAYQPRLSGQAFCYFLADRFYEQAVAQLYGQLKKKKNLRRSIRLIAKKELDSLYILCFDYYTKRFDIKKDTVSLDTNSFKIPRKKGVVKAILPAEDLNAITYVTSKNNTRRVYNYNTLTGTTTKLNAYQLPPWINDYSRDNYPVLNRDASGKILLTQPQKGTIITKQYSSIGSKYAEDEITGIDGVSSVHINKTGSYLLSGYRKGQSDIVSYNAARERYTPYTNDTYDDNDLSLVNGHMYFTSSRPFAIEDDTTVYPLAQGIYEVNNGEVKTIVKDTINYIRWGKPTTWSPNELLVTHTEHGIERYALVNSRNHSVYNLGAYEPVTVYPQSGNVITHDVTRDSLQINNTSQEAWLAQQVIQDRPSAWLLDYRKREKQRALEDSIISKSRNESSTFLRGILMPANAQEEAEQRKDSIAGSLAYNARKVKPYILQLHSAYFSVKANNDYFINRYQPYLNYQGSFKFPEIGAMIQAGFSDLFENHHIGIGFRVPTTTEGSDFFLTYNNTAKKTDWGLTYFRKVETVKPDPKRTWTNEKGEVYPNLAKVNTHYYALSLKKPVTYYLSVGLEQAFRSDRTIFQATDKYSLLFEDINSLWSITTLSLKQYHLKPTVPMLHKGYSGKILLDGFKAFTQDEAAFYAVSLQTEYHQPIYKYITLVSRLQAGHSAGAAHMLYNIAGVDNNVVAKIDSSKQFNQTAPYAFQSLVTPFRGYLQNSFYGNQYAVLNADLYFPLFQTLIPVETPLPFINLLQLGMFTDIGTAKETWQKPRIKQGWLWSYGLSVRSKLAGYSIRMDVAWPGALNKKPLWYFTLGS